MGKTSLARATALLCRRHGKNVIYASWSPLDEEAPPSLLEKEGIEWLALQATQAFREYALKILRFEKLYETIFENQVLKTFILAAPGLSQTVIAGKLWDLYENGSQDIVVVDLPASGHTYSFFQSPFGVKRIFRTGFVYREALKIIQMFESSASRLDFVGIPEEMSVEENRQFYDKLKFLAPFSMGYLLVNQCLPTLQMPSPADFSTLSLDAKGIVERYEASKKLEEEALALAKSLPLPALHVPRFSTDDEAKILNEIARTLDKA